MFLACCRHCFWSYCLYDSNIFETTARRSINWNLIFDNEPFRLRPMTEIKRKLLQGDLAIERHPSFATILKLQLGSEADVRNSCQEPRQYPTSASAYGGTVLHCCWHPLGTNTEVVRNFCWLRRYQAMLLSSLSASVRERRRVRKRGQNLIIRL